MAMRSWLFVPGDSEAKLGKVAGCGADVVIVDLEDAVAPPAKAHARMLAKAWLQRHTATPFARWVRINPLDTALWREDLAAVMPGKPDGVMVPKAAGPEQLQVLAGELSVHEQRNGARGGIDPDPAAGQRDARGRSRHRALCRRRAAAPRRADLGRGRPVRGARRDTQARRGRRLDGHLPLRPRASAARRARAQGHGDRHAARRFPRSRGAAADRRRVLRRRLHRDAGDPSDASAGDQHRFQPERG